MKPTVIIDSISLLSPLTGIGRYTYNIAANMQKNGEHTLYFFYGYASTELIEPKKRSKARYLKALVSRSDTIKKLLRKAIFATRRFSTKKFDIYWEPNFIPLENIKAKRVVTTVHDFSFILHRDFHPKGRIEYFEKNFSQNIYRSDYIITGSEFTKREILQRLDFPKERVEVIYHGVDHDTFYPRNDAIVPFLLPQKFILFVGSIEPRKNLLGLLEAYNILAPDIKERYKLVLVGFKGWENQEVMRLIQKNKQNIYYLGYVTDEELAKVYNLASLFVFASFYEGFGLPVLEAMACGTPVVCSNSSSLPEVGADAARYFDPKNIQDIAQTIASVLADEALQDAMVQKGLQRAKAFTWECSAKKHQEVFQKVLTLK